MSIGAMLKKCREQMEITQQEVAERSGYSRSSITNWEKGRRVPDIDVVKALARVLDTSVAYLAGETEDPEAAQILKNTDTELIKIPIIDLTKICAGLKDGNINKILAETSGQIALPISMLGPIGERRPFAVKMQGDGMENAGILQDSEAAINPEMEVSDGDAALVCFGTKKECTIKWVYFHTDGSIELRSSTPNYPPRFYNKEEIANGWCQIIGKVMRILQAPKRGI